ncbi:N,N-dimethylformamidase beta subunit family domain-containing protein [Bailinhaonella thermotolerans]|uniref:N,N-dimethylformamidase beta subunit-like C-terminal domain-containing protein n=1 Tax=Bailinhaonella thermotolerans TaxID=1070861 RepID=A0A3A4AYZ2_9ACTN|nr:N,N-dimethylformamidase beta subunit family domain-containing protein [Bailinhaonella thermotolerans]RJL32726.1 hypothetical protein D5H75_14675 [Bailinhaonella thermotolerans]
MIRGYAEQPSPRAGGRVTLRVATDAPEFRVEFHRCGDGLTRHGGSGWLPGRDAPHHPPYADWGRPGTSLAGEPLAPWPEHSFEVPAGWPPGVYVAILVEGDGRGRDRSDPDRSTADGRSARALFVVRPAPDRAPAPILYKLPLLTYHAYNTVDGEPYDAGAGRGQWCLYNHPEDPALPTGVSVHRPGGGTGGTPYDVDNFDPFDPTPRQTYVHWDGRFAAWLEREGYEADFCTDVDLHREGRALLRPYRLMVSAGHDEYWSEAMRDAAEGYVGDGGNIAFFGGNTCWWRVVFHDDVTYSRVGFWHEEGRPENHLTGVSFRNGGERDRDEHPVRVGYRVQHAGHWVYEGTGLRDGDVFGEEEYVVGYECDGADFRRTRSPAVPTCEDGTPRTFTILAVGDAKASGWGFGNAAATLGVYERGGTVFNAATTDWPRALGNRHVARVTRNVLTRLSGGNPPR